MTTGLRKGFEDFEEYYKLESTNLNSSPLKYSLKMEMTLVSDLRQFPTNLIIAKVVPTPCIKQLNRVFQLGAPIYSAIAID